MISYFLSHTKTHKAELSMYNGKISTIDLVYQNKAYHPFINLISVDYQ